MFIKKTGLSPDEVRGKLVLDAGVGAGRFCDVLSSWGANVIGADLSYAVEASHKNFINRPNVLVAQADIGSLPFEPGTFDYIVSIGVLHHTPDTKTYFKRLVPLLKPGGSIAIWVYPFEGDYIVRKQWIRFTHMIPDRMFYQWCRWFVPMFQRHRSNNFLCWFRRMFPMSDQGLGLENDILDTFDGFSPRYHGIHSPEEVEGWFKEAGLINIRQPSDWTTSVRGDKPL
jgi:SAM-dependent methyltransferase